MLRKRLATVFLSISIATSTPVHAGAWTGGATEITQILNNLELLMQTIIEDMHYYTDLENLAIQVLQQASGSDSTLSGAASRAGSLLQSARGALRAADNMKASIGSLHKVGTLRYQNYVSSGLSWDAYIARETEIAQNVRQRSSILSETEEAAINQVKDNWQVYQQYQSEIRTSEGEHQAMRIMNGQMNALLGTMNSMLQVTAQRSSAATEEEFQRASREQEEIEARDARRDAIRQNNQYGHDQLKKLKQL